MRKPFKLLVVLVTYNRLEYTKRTLKGFRSTIDDDTSYYIVAVDNNSTDGTQRYLESCRGRGLIDMVVLNPDNYYPGKACNMGWELGLALYPEATHLMRLDNDMFLKRGWDLAVKDYFEAIPELGQLGYDHEAIENPSAELKQRTINGKTINPFPGCIGGPNIIRRKIWDSGIRYDEKPWSKSMPNTPTEQEDFKLSMAIMDKGWIFGHMQEDFGRTFANPSNWHEYKDYYKKTMNERGYERDHAWLYEDDSQQA